MDREGGRGKREDECKVEHREARATALVRAMPTMPRPDDHQSVRLGKVAAWRAWTEQTRQRVGGDTELSNLVLEKIKDCMGLNDPDPTQAAENARDLLAAGMGDIGITRRADEAMRRRDIDPAAVAGHLVQEYVNAWAGCGLETIITRQVGGETLCIGHRDALRINMWVSGEPGTPTVPLDELNPNA